LLWVRPAGALLWQKDILSKLSDYIALGVGEFDQVIRSILILGGILILIGISARLSMSFISEVVYA